MRFFAEVFRRVGLTKSVQLYPYLRWALRHAPAATMQLCAVQRHLDAATMRVDATMSGYLEAPWGPGRRHRFARDVAGSARTFAQILREEEASIFPLYLPPGQYTFVGWERRPSV